MDSGEGRGESSRASGASIEAIEVLVELVWFDADDLVGLP